MRRSVIGTTRTADESDAGSEVCRALRSAWRAAAGALA